MTSPDPKPILAAGCVLWRPSPSGHGIEIALVHRPKYDDWSHPKGKRKRGESAEACALREVLEETGHHCALGARLSTVRYAVDGRPKEVAYWAARALGGTFVPGHEVDRLLWLPPAAARTRLTQPRDRSLLDALLATAASPGGPPGGPPDREPGRPSDREPGREPGRPPDREPGGPPDREPGGPPGRQPGDAR